MKKSAIESPQPRGLRNTPPTSGETWIICCDYQGQNPTVLGFAVSETVATEIVWAYSKQGHDQRFFCHLWKQQWNPYLGKLNPDDAIRYQYPIEAAAQQMADAIVYMTLDDKLNAGHFTTPPYLYNFSRAMHEEVEGHMWARFKTEMALELDMVGHPKFDALYDKAYAGHGSGMHEVLNYARELVDLVK